MNDTSHILHEFAEFLNTRIQIEGLDIFHSMIDNYLNNLDDIFFLFIQVGGTIIRFSPLPTLYQETTYQHGKKLLQKKRHPTTIQYCNFFDGLSLLLATRNISILKAFYVDFCNSREEKLHKFLQLGMEIICILPESNRNYRTPISTPWSAVQRRKDKILSNNKKHEIIPTNNGKRRELMDIESSNILTSEAKRKRRAPVIYSDNHPPIYEQRRSTRESVTPSKYSPSKENHDSAMPPELTDDDNTSSFYYNVSHTRELELSIQEKFFMVEAMEPWKEVYTLKNISVTAITQNKPELNDGFTLFWSRHAQAVWERRFWCPYSYTLDHEASKTRKRRQSLAMRSFERNVIIPLYNAYGVQIFIDLDKNFHPAWWYADSLYSLKRLFRSNGRQALSKYLENASTKPPSKTHVFPHFRLGNNVSRSMWSKSTSCIQITRAILRERGKDSLLDLQHNLDVQDST